MEGWVDGRIGGWVGGLMDQCLITCPPTCLPAYLHTCLLVPSHTNLPTCLSFHSPTHLPACPLTGLHMTDSEARIGSSAGPPPPERPPAAMPIPRGPNTPARTHVSPAWITNQRRCRECTMATKRRSPCKRDDRVRRYSSWQAHG